MIINRNNKLQLKMEYRDMVGIKQKSNITSYKDETNVYENKNQETISYSVSRHKRRDLISINNESSKRKLASIKNNV